MTDDDKAGLIEMLEREVKAGRITSYRLEVTEGERLRVVVVPRGYAAHVDLEIGFAK